jgi:hypothetical protein
MADNVNITPGSGAVIASDEVAGAQYQRVKVTWGADGTATDASTSNPLPVQATSGITTIGDDRKTVTTAGTRVALASSTACKQVIITAETDNTGNITVGGSTVVAALATRRGIPLAAGDSVALEIDNLADVYIDSTVNGDGVTFAYFS